MRKKSLVGSDSNVARRKSDFYLSFLFFPRLCEVKNILQEEEEAKVTCSKERKEEKEEVEAICEGDTFFSSLSARTAKKVRICKNCESGFPYISHRRRIVDKIFFASYLHFVKKCVALSLI